ncbi:dipeptide transport system permease DppC [Klebsiella pneumoniae]|nr:dipeptide transport system permease DppC [Klebsiella pneumoniae]
MRFTDLMMAFPALLLAIALAAIFQPSVWIVSLVIAMVNWVQIARVIYAETSALSARDFIAVERTLGAGWCSFPARRLCCCRSLSISLVTPCATPSIPA